MKKVIFSALAAAAVLASCTKFVYDEPVKFIEAETPEVTAKAVSDSAITVTVVPKQSTSFYSYIVAEGPAENLDSEALLKALYKSDALKVGDTTYCEVIDFAKQATVKRNIKGLAPNTYYTVYAVANNAQGKISSVATATCITTDALAPVFQKSSCVENDSSLVYTITFDDRIILAQDENHATKPVTAHVFGLFGGFNSDGSLLEQRSYEVPADSVKTQGNTLIVSLPRAEYTPGAYVTLSYPEGTVINSLKDQCAAFDVTAVTRKATEDWYEGSSKGIMGSYAAVTYPISLYPEGDPEDEMTEEDEEEEEIEPEVFTNWKTLQMKSYFQSPYDIYYVSAEVSVVDNNERTVSYPVQNIDTGADGLIIVGLDEDPGYGTYVSYSIPAESVYDIYGNTNTDFEVKKGFFSSYGYAVADIAGTYSVSGYSLLQRDYVSYTLTIAESDDAKKGNIVITNYLGIQTKLYATFDLDSGYFTIAENEGLYLNSTNSYYYVTDFNGYKEAVFNVTKAGYITSDYYVGAYVYDSSNDNSEVGYYELLYYFEATRED